MDQRKVLLRKTPNGAYVQIGLIIARHGKSLTVQTSEGVIAEQERLSGDLTPAAGSYFHLLRLAPDTVERLLSESPERIFKQLIHDFPGLTEKELKAKLGDGLGPVADRAWSEAVPALAADQDVVPSDGRVPKFRLRQEVDVDLRDLVPPFAPTPGVNDAPLASSNGADEPAGSAGSASSSDEPPVTGPATPASPLMEELGQIAVEFGIRSTSHLARHLLAIGNSVARLPAPAQADLVESLKPEDRRLLSIATGRLKDNLLADEVGSLGAADYEEALTAGLAEIADQPADAKALVRALTRLLERAATNRSLAPELLIRLAKVFAEHRSKDGVEVCLAQLSDALGGLSPSDLAGLDLRGLARASRSSSLAREHGRTRLISALYRVLPDEATDSRWWHGVTLEELSGAARGTLGTVLEDDRVALHTVAPIVRDYLGAVSSRSGAAVIWGLPSPLARHVTGEQLSQVLRRVSASDPMLEAWLDTLASTNLLRSLRERNADLEASLRRDQAAVRQATLEADDLRARLKTAADQLAAARLEDTSSRQAHDRQIRIDTVRALAVLAAQVGQSPTARSDDALMRQVEHACRREGLDEIGRVGESVKYDPQVHESLSQGLHPAGTATVVRGGYTWVEGDQTFVLVKAHVMAG